MTINSILCSTTLLCRRERTLAFVALSALLTACGGGSGGTSAAESKDGMQQSQGVKGTVQVPATWKGRAPLTLAMQPIPEASSPFEGAAAQKGRLSDGTEVYVRVDDINGKKTSTKVLIDSKKTGGNTAQLAGQTFLEFKDDSTKTMRVAISNTKIATVYECSLETKECIVLPFTKSTDGIAFTATQNAFYALEK